MRLGPALLSVGEQTLGPEHPDTLDTRSDLAFWIGEAGDPANARDQFAALLPVIKRVLGPEHPQTLTVLAADQLILRPEHPDTLITRGNLAYWMDRESR